LARWAGRTGAIQNAKVLVRPGTQVEAGDLLIRLE
jgi:biotin carboxyl carrier protein